MFNIKHLKIENHPYNIINSEFDDGLDDLSKVNIFVGANNSGKSRFMRSLFYVNKNTKLNFLVNDELFDYFINQSKIFKEFIQKPNRRIYSDNEVKAFQNINYYLNEIEYFVESESPFQSLSIIGKNLEKSKISRGTYEYYCDEIFKEYFERIKFDDNLFKYNFYKIYIPSLRGLVPLIPKEVIQDNDSQDDFYAERIKQDYFGEKSSILVDVNDFLLTDEVTTRNAIISGLQFYDYVKNYLLGDFEQREIIREYEEYLSETFFDNKKVVLIPKVNDDVLTVKIGDEEYKIYDLGEGIQSIILITLPLFLYLKKSKEINTSILVFIEEPEVGLHPSLQRKLLETLLSSRFENYQFFFTTHSNHFMDKAFEKGDISIYSFDKTLKSGDKSIAEFTIEKVGFDHLPTLKRLGALPSSVLSHNCTILVEGSYDIAHYSFYLDLYQDELIESGEISEKFRHGTHYSFLRGGGKETAKTIDEFNPIQKQRIFTILDKDDNKEYEKNEVAFDEMDYKKYYILNVREVENLISKDVLIKILRSLRELRQLKINEDFEEEDYQKSNFHTFIKNTIVSGKKEGNFLNKNTFKKRFSYKEQEFTESFDDLSEPAKEVTKKIFNFIKENNSADLI